MTSDTLIWFAVIIAVIGAAFFFRNDSDAGKDTVSGRVRHIVDGDSLYIEGHKPQIRLWGVDAPEKDENGYNAAKSYLTRIAKGKRITCEIMDTDRYGRTVGRCTRKDGKQINRMMIESGRAQEYCRYSKGYYGHC